MFPEPVSKTTRNSCAGEPTLSTPEYEVLKEAILPRRYTGTLSLLKSIKKGWLLCSGSETVSD